MFIIGLRGAQATILVEVVVVTVAGGATVRNHHVHPGFPKGRHTVLTRMAIRGEVRYVCQTGSPFPRLHENMQNKSR